MLLGIGLGIPYKRKYMGLLSPCLTDILYWSSIFSLDNLFLNDKSGLGNNVPLVNANCIYFNNTDNYILKTSATPRQDNTFSFKGWVRHQGADGTFYSEGLSGSGNQVSIFFGILNFAPQIGITDQSGTQHLFSMANIITFNDWAYVEVDYDGFTLIGKKDGIVVQTHVQTIEIAKQATMLCAVGGLAYAPTTSPYNVQGRWSGIIIDNSSFVMELPLSEGVGASIVDASDGEILTFGGDMSLSWSFQQDKNFENSKGCSTAVKYVNGVPNYKYIRFDNNNNPLLSEGEFIEGYKWLSDNDNNNNMSIPNCEIDLDFIAASASNPTDLIDWNIKDSPQPDSKNKRFFLREEIEKFGVQIIGYGNSLMKSNSCDATFGYLETLEQNLIAQGIDVEVINLGVNGRKGSDMVNFYDIEVTPVWDYRKVRILITSEFTNDIAVGGVSAVQANLNIKSVCDQGKADGAIVIVKTAPSLNGVPVIDDANVLLRADNTFADYMIDENSVSDLFVMTNPANSCDQIHFTQLAVNTIQEPFTRDFLIDNNIVFAGQTNEIIKSIDRIVTYNKDQPAPSGACFNQTIDYVNVKKYALRDVNSQIIYDANNEYIIPKYF
jgi:hypothetical protein